MSGFNKGATRGIEFRPTEKEHLAAGTNPGQLPCPTKNHSGFKEKEAQETRKSV